MNRTEILDEVTKANKEDIRLKLAECNSEDWFDDNEPLSVYEKAVLDGRVAAYATDPNAGSTWEEVEGRIRAALLARRTNDSEPNAGPNMLKNYE
jgi:hypothetical protein